MEHLFNLLTGLYSNSSEKSILEYKHTLKERTGEKHHILPKSIFPELAKDLSNIIELSPWDHLQAHRLLWEITKDLKMLFAYNQMLGRNVGIRSEEEFNKIKTLAHEQISLKAKGRKQSQETIRKRVEKITGKKRTPEQIENSASAHRGLHYNLSDEQREIISERGRNRKGIPKHSGFGEKVSKSSIGKPKPWIQGENHPNFGKPVPQWKIDKAQETKRRNGTEPKGEKNPMYRSVFVFMTKDKVNKRVHPDNINEYMLLGWVRGKFEREERCIYCGKTVLLRLHTRYHGEKCPLRDTNNSTEMPQ